MALKEELEKQGNWLFRYRSFLPLIVLLIGLFVSVQTSIRKADTDCKIYYELVCLCVSVIGLAIRIYTVGFTPKNTSGRNTREGQVADELNTKGIYSIVRNPLYLGNFFMWLGLAIFTENVWFIISFILFYWIYYERIIFAEEQFLERKFGPRYRSWSSEVPVFIPKPSLFKNNEQPFSIQKVLLKEKNGLFALFLIFTVFDVAGEIIQDHAHYNLIFIIGAFIAMLVYAVMKIIKTRTFIFRENR